MAYNISTDVNWSSRYVSATISSDSYQQVTGLYFALADSRGNWLTHPQETLSGSHSGLAYTKIDFTPFGYQPHAFCFSGRTDQFQYESGFTYTQQSPGVNGRTANENDPLNQNWLSPDPNFYIGRDIIFNGGSRRSLKQVSTVTGAQNLITVTIAGGGGKRGDYLEHSGDFYRILTGINEGADDEYILDRSPSNIAVNDWVAIYPVARITGMDVSSGAIQHDFVRFNGSTWTELTNGYTAAVQAGDSTSHVTIAINNTGDIPEYTSIEVGDYFLYSTSAFTGWVTDVSDLGEFTILTGGYGNLDSGAYSYAKVDTYFIDLGPQPDTAMMGVLLNNRFAGTGDNIIHTQNVPPDQSSLEINFNEYDSSVASVGTKAHFHVGPVIIGGHAMTGGTTSMNANLYGGDRTLKKTWALTPLDNYFSASSNTGQFYDELIGSYSVNTSESFAQSDMLYFRAAIVVNGRKVERGITIASQPVV